MRKIKYRAKCNDKKLNKDWVFGIPMQLSNNDCVIYSESNNAFAFPVTFETIGEYIGLNDSNNKEIYEGDICFGTSIFHSYEENFIVTFDNRHFYL